jgi:hypothetical protein
MSGQSISGHADPDTVARLRLLSSREGRISSQITAAALLFYLNLPAAAHAGLREIEAFGSPEERHNMARAITRAIVGANFEIGRRRAAASMQVANEDILQTDEDILVEAVRLTTPPN